MYLAQFKIPGPGGTTEDVQAPSGIPSQLKGSFDTSGQALIQLALQWLFIIGATLSVIFIIYSGIQWITSGGDPGKIAAAKKRLIYAIIGLVVISSAFAIVKIIFTILGGNSDYFFNFGSLGANP